MLGGEGPELTIGNDAGTAGAMESLGAKHVECPVTEFVVDHERKLITSPAYMLATSISEAAEGIEKTVAELMEMAQASTVSSIAGLTLLGRRVMNLTANS